METKIFATCLCYAAMLQCHALPCIAMLYFGINHSTVFATSSTFDFNFCPLGRQRGGLIGKVNAEHGHGNEHGRHYGSAIHRAVIETLELLSPLEDEHGAFHAGLSGACQRTG